MFNENINDMRNETVSILKKRMPFANIITIDEMLCRVVYCDDVINIEQKGDFFYLYVKGVNAPEILRNVDDIVSFLIKL